MSAEQARHLCTSITTTTCKVYNSAREDHSELDMPKVQTASLIKTKRANTREVRLRVSKHLELFSESCFPLQVVVGNNRRFIKLKVLFVSRKESSRKYYSNFDE
jgi:chorismate-pyruvate lyase